MVALGPVPLIPYGMPSTTELADNVGRAICDAHAILLAHHGALAVGDSLWRAWERMETLVEDRAMGPGMAFPHFDTKETL